jgi:SRSO17 transposase
VAPTISGWQRWLLVRRSLDEGTKPAEMAYVLVFAPTGTSLKEMVEADRAHAGRWSSVLRKGKEKWAWMSMRVRSWHGWYRHVTLSMLALAFLTVLRAHDDEDALKKSLNRRLRRQSQKQTTLFKPLCLLISQSWFPSVLPKSGGFSFVL